MSSIIITVVSGDGERGHNMIVVFGTYCILSTFRLISSHIKYNNYCHCCTDTYDVQSVRGRTIPGGLELSCTFAEGSQVQSCILTIYRIHKNGMEILIANVSIGREKPQASGQVSNLRLGEYVVREVAEVESDGEVTIHRRRDVLKLVLTEPATAITSVSTMSTPGCPFIVK